MEGEKKGDTKLPICLAVAGWKNSGKTRLIEALLAELGKRGKKAAVIKHDGHEFCPDVPGTDTFRFQKSGALGTILFSNQQLLVSRSRRADSAGSPFSFAAYFPDADWILFEGLKDSALPKIEVFRDPSAAGCCTPDTVLCYVFGQHPQKADQWSHLQKKPVFTWEEAGRLLDYCEEEYHKKWESCVKTMWETEHSIECF